MKLWLSLAFLFALAAPAVCQSTSSSAADYNADTTTTIVKTVNEVNLVFTVSDRHGHFIKDLKRDDIKVLDDNKPAAIASFSSQTDLPLRVGLLIDASSSIRDRFRFEQASAIEFLNQIVRRGVCAWLRFRL